MAPKPYITLTFSDIKKRKSLKVIERLRTSYFSGTSSERFENLVGFLYKTFFKTFFGKTFKLELNAFVAGGRDCGRSRRRDHRLVLAAAMAPPQRSAAARRLRLLPGSRSELARQCKSSKIEMALDVSNQRPVMLVRLFCLVEALNRSAACPQPAPCRSAGRTSLRDVDLQHVLGLRRAAARVELDGHPAHGRGEAHAEVGHGRRPVRVVALHPRVVLLRGCGGG